MTSHDPYSVRRRRKSDKDRNATVEGLSAPASSRKTRKISSRWTQTIRDASREEELVEVGRSYRGNGEERIDLVGDHLAQLINSNPAFTRPEGDDIAGQSNETDIFRPLLSGHNLRRWRRQLGNVALSSPRQQSIRIVRYLRQILMFVTKYHTSTRSALRVFGFCLCFSLLGLVTMLHVAVIWLVKRVIVAGSNIVSLLLDGEEIKANCPVVLLSLLSAVTKFAASVDSIMFLGNRLVGRDWNDDSHLRSGSISAQSRHESLWVCPPPSVKLGRDKCLEAQEIQQINWSQQTTQHVLAINFCYVMLHDDFQRKQLGNKAPKKSKSLPSTVEMSELEKQVKATKSHKVSFQMQAHLPVKQYRSAEDGESMYHPEKLVKSASADESRRMMTIRTRSVTGPGESVEVVGSIRHCQGQSDESRRRSYSDTDIGDSLHDSEDTDSSSPIERSELGDDFSATLVRRRGKLTSSEHSFPSNASDVAAELNWLDVGTRIGMRLLNSEHVQRAVASQDTAERILDIGKQVESKLKKSERRGLQHDSDGRLNSVMKGIRSTEGASDDQRDVKNERETVLVPPLKPIHAMWTSPSSVAAPRSGNSLSSISDLDDTSVASDIPSPPLRDQKRPSVPDDSMLPPRSPQHQPKVPKRPPLMQKIVHDREHRLVESQDISSLKTKASPKERETSKQGDKATQKGSLKKESRTCNAVDNIGNGRTADILRGSRSVPSTPPTSTGIYDVGLRDEAECDAAASEPTEREPIIATRSPARHSTSNQISPSSPPKIPARRRVLDPGVKVVVPIFPTQPALIVRPTKAQGSRFQMATVASSKRIHLCTASCSKHNGAPTSNCLSVTVKLDKSFLRDGEFAEMSFRVLDEWSSRYMPRHSKFPIGACVATSYGLGVLVGWRVEDDCHVVRSLWQRRGAGSAHAYLNRSAVHGVVEAAVGFQVQTTRGRGAVLAYANGGKEFLVGRFFVVIKEEGRYKGHVQELHRSDILSCQGAEFIPVIELVREAAQYQIQMDNYEAALRHQTLEMSHALSINGRLLQSWSKGFEVIWESFLKAIEEDSDFDEGMNNFVTSIISFLERLDGPQIIERKEEQEVLKVQPDKVKDDAVSTVSKDDKQPGFWLMNGVFGDIFQKSKGGNKKKSHSKKKSRSTPETSKTAPNLIEDLSNERNVARKASSYDRAYAVIRTLMKTVSIARVASVDQPDLHLALAICFEFLLFVRTVIKVQQKNVSPHSMAIWKRAIEEIVATFGPIKDRLEKIGRGIAERMEQQGKRAKIRILRFVDIVLVDERLLVALERGEWDRCIERLENAMVQANIIDEESREHYHKTIMFIYDHLAPSSSRSHSAAARNGQKLAHLAKALKWMASPRRSCLRFLRRDDVLEMFERILVRVFHGEKGASQMLTIHASNFHTLRQLRMLKDFTIAGKLWIPLLDAADEEFAWAVSKMPENTKDVMRPLSKLFSLCVAQFHKLGAGDLTADWLDFLMEDDAATLIHEIDVTLILGVEALCQDVKEVMVALPYYPSIDDDILNLMDEVDLDEFLKEASDAIVDSDKLADFLREKTTIAIERFLDYLPKMSIPVERRELGDGWVLTCRGENGGDLTLSDVNIKRENLICQVLGGETLFFPMFGDDCSDNESVASTTLSSVTQPSDCSREASILDHIRDILLQAQSNGCWQVGFGGVDKPPSDRYVASLLKGLFVTEILNCAIELWRNLEIDDDELLEIAIRDVTSQILLHSEKNCGSDAPSHEKQSETNYERPPTIRSHIAVALSGAAIPGLQGRKQKGFDWKDRPRRRFNPRHDPTVLFLEMKKLTLNLDRFHFRIEKIEKTTIFDPVFEGQGTVCVQNVSIKIRVECRKERINKLGSDWTVPVLQLQELEVCLEKVKFKVKDTGADWLLNKVVSRFSENITDAVEGNLKDQVKKQVHAALENLNSYFVVNPDLMLGLLGISIEDLEENIVWV